MNRFPVITICGSMRYYGLMLTAAQEYTHCGTIVLMPFVAIDPDEQSSNYIKEMLDRMHFAKIDMSDAILVVGSHRGESTLREIAYAIEKGKEVRGYAQS